MNKENSIRTRKMVLMALFAAIVVVLQLLGSFIKIGTMFSVSLVLVPIVVGASLCGVSAGAILGAVFGIVVLISGDAAAFMTVNPFGTVLTVMLKGTFAGLASGLVYKALEKKHLFLAVLTAAIVCPIVNTGIFFLGCLIFFLDYCVNVAASFGFTGNAALGIIIYFIGLNFVAEFLANVILCGVIERLVSIGKKVFKQNT